MSLFDDEVMSVTLQFINKGAANMEAAEKMGRQIGAAFDSAIRKGFHVGKTIDEISGAIGKLNVQLDSLSKRYASADAEAQRLSRSERARHEALIAEGRRAAVPAKVSESVRGVASEASILASAAKAIESAAKSGATPKELAKAFIELNKSIQALGAEYRNSVNAALDAKSQGQQRAIPPPPPKDPPVSAETIKLAIASEARKALSRFTDERLRQIEYNEREKTTALRGLRSGASSTVQDALSQQSLAELQKIASATKTQGMSRVSGDRPTGLIALVDLETAGKQIVEGTVRLIEINKSTMRQVEGGVDKTITFQQRYENYSVGGMRRLEKTFEKVQKAGDSFADHLHNKGSEFLHGKDFDLKKLVDAVGIPVTAIRHLLSKADFIVSHNAAFEQGHLAPIVPGIMNMPWYDPMTAVPWPIMRAGPEKFASAQEMIAKYHNQLAPGRAHRSEADVETMRRMLFAYHQDEFGGGTYLQIGMRRVLGPKTEAQGQVAKIYDEFNEMLNGIYTQLRMPRGPNYLDVASRTQRELSGAGPYTYDPFGRPAAHDVPNVSLLLGQTSLSLSNSADTIRHFLRNLLLGKPEFMVSEYNKQLGIVGKRYSGRSGLNSEDIMLRAAAETNIAAMLERNTVLKSRREASEILAIEDEESTVRRRAERRAAYLERVVHGEQSSTVALKDVYGVRFPALVHETPVEHEDVDAFISKQVASGNLGGGVREMAAMARRVGKLHPRYDDLLSLIYTGQEQNRERNEEAIRSNVSASYGLSPSESVGRSVYIAGPMRGIPELNFPEFYRIAAKWEKQGWRVVNPAQMDKEHGYVPTKTQTSFANLSIEQAMARDLPAVASVDAIALMRGWERSQGANMELKHAIEMGKHVYDAETFRRVKAVPKQLSGPPVVQEAEKRTQTMADRLRKMREEVAKFTSSESGSESAEWAMLLGGGGILGAVAMVGRAALSKLRQLRQRLFGLQRPSGSTPDPTAPEPADAPMSVDDIRAYQRRLRFESKMAGYGENIGRTERDLRQYVEGDYREAIAGANRKYANAVQGLGLSQQASSLRFDEVSATIAAQKAKAARNLSRIVDDVGVSTSKSQSSKALKSILLSQDLEDYEVGLAARVKEYERESGTNLTREELTKKLGGATRVKKQVNAALAKFEAFKAGSPGGLTPTVDEIIAEAVNTSEAIAAAYVGKSKIGSKRYNKLRDDVLGALYTGSDTMAGDERVRRAREDEQAARSALDAREQRNSARRANANDQARDKERRAAEDHVERLAKIGRERAEREQSAQDRIDTNTRRGREAQQSFLAKEAELAGRGGGGRGGRGGAGGAGGAGGGIPGLGDFAHRDALGIGIGAAAVAGTIKMGRDVLVDTTKYAARTETLELATRQMAQANGLNTDAVLAEVEAMKRLNITTQEAHLTVQKMMFAQLDVAKATQLARTAQDVAIIANVNSSVALEKIILGINTGQTRLLHNMGLQVSLLQTVRELRQEKRAAGDKTEPTEFEKREAMFKKVLQVGANVAGTYEVAMLTAGKQYNSLTREVQETMNAIGKEFIPEFGGAVSTITTGLRSMQAHSSDVAKLGSAFVSLGAAAGAASTLGFANWAWKQLPLPLPAKLIGGAIGLGAMALLNRDHNELLVNTAIEQEGLRAQGHARSIDMLARLEAQGPGTTEDDKKAFINSKDILLAQIAGYNRAKTGISTQLTEQLAAEYDKRTIEHESYLKDISGSNGLLSNIAARFRGDSNNTGFFGFLKQAGELPYRLTTPDSVLYLDAQRNVVVPGESPELGVSQEAVVRRRQALVKRREEVALIPPNLFNADQRWLSSMHSRFMQAEVDLQKFEDRYTETGKAVEKAKKFMGSPWEKIHIDYEMEMSRLTDITKSVDEAKKAGAEGEQGRRRLEKLYELEGGGDIERGKSKIQQIYDDQLDVGKQAVANLRIEEQKLYDARDAEILQIKERTAASTIQADVIRGNYASEEQALLKLATLSKATVEAQFALLRNPIARQVSLTAIEEGVKQRLEERRGQEREAERARAEARSQFATDMAARRVLNDPSLNPEVALQKSAQIRLENAAKLLDTQKSLNEQQAISLHLEEQLYALNRERSRNRAEASVDEANDYAVMRAELDRIETNRRTRGSARDIDEIRRTRDLRIGEANRRYEALAPFASGIGAENLARENSAAVRRANIEGVVAEARVNDQQARIDRNELIDSYRMQYEREARLRQLRADGAAEEAAEAYNTHQLRMELIDKEYTLRKTKGIEDAEADRIRSKEQLDADYDQLQTLMSLRRKEIEDVRGGAGRVFDAITTRGGHGLTEFAQGQFRVLGRQIFQNIAAIWFKNVRESLGNLIPGQETVDANGQRRVTTLGQVFSSTVLGKTHTGEIEKLKDSVASRTVQSQERLRDSIDQLRLTIENARALADESEKAARVVPKAPYLAPAARDIFATAPFEFPNIPASIVEEMSRPGPVPALPSANIYDIANIPSISPLPPFKRTYDLALRNLVPRASATAPIASDVPGVPSNLGLIGVKIPGTIEALPKQFETIKLGDVAARAVASEGRTGVPAEAIVAQWALESGWGKHSIGNNYFGITSLSGGRVAKTMEDLTWEQYKKFAPKTTETPWEGRKRVEVSRTFAEYGSGDESFAAHEKLLTGPKYAAALEQYKKDNDIGAYFKAVAPIYATDRNYAKVATEIAGQRNVVDAVSAARTASASVAAPIVADQGLSAAVQSDAAATLESVAVNSELNASVLRLTEVMTGVASAPGAVGRYDMPGAYGVPGVPGLPGPSILAGATTSINAASPLSVLSNISKLTSGSVALLGSAMKAQPGAATSQEPPTGSTESVTSTIKYDTKSASGFSKFMGSLAAVPAGANLFDVISGRDKVRTSGGRQVEMSGAERAGAIAGAAATVAGGALLAVQGFQKGGAKGALQGASGILTAASVIPVVGPYAALGAMALQFVSGLLGDPKEARRRAIDQYLAQSKYIAPVQVNAEMTTGGNTIAYDKFGRPVNTGTNVLPIHIQPTVWRPSTTSEHDLPYVEIPGRVLDSPVNRPTPTVYINPVIQVQAMDSRSIIDRSADIAQAVHKELKKGSDLSVSLSTSIFGA